MKKERIRKNNQNNKKLNLWVWILLAFLFGGLVGYCTHYIVVNWHGFFAVCQDGDRPDKNGCCTGEIYTDAGDCWMVCCPVGGDNCFPPVK